LGVRSGLEGFVDVLGPSAEALLILGLAPESGDSHVVCGRVQGDGGSQGQRKELLHTTPHFRRSIHSIARSDSANRNMTGISQRSLVSRVVIPASEYEICSASFPMSFAV